MIQKRRWTGSIVLFGLVLIALSHCRQHPENGKTKTEKYWNHGDSVHYVGIETCASCHQDVYQTYIETGMGQSYKTAHKGKSKARFEDHLPVYDSVLDYYYTAFWRHDSLYVKEYRLLENDTIHRIEKRIDDIIGSGQHTNSHIFSVNGHYYQAPITWYVQKDLPDLPPGYENGANSRFSRIIGLECMSCHNAMPAGFVKGSENKFNNLPQGIDCERCHGPGSAHVAKIQRGNITDTAKETDYSIVNPKKLTSQLRFEICQRCHLQGNAVLRANASFFDFLPGMHLKDVMDIYVPRYANDSTSFIMASHVDRFTMSKCYRAQPDDFVCTTCHNPHKSVKITGAKTFNNTCKNCHGDSKNVCSEHPGKREAADNNCVHCHMPASGSSDIPHVFVHDHYIRKDYNDTQQEKKQKIFAGLVAINNPNPGFLSRINAYLQQYERFDEASYMLDSAFILLNKNGFSQHRHEWIHYYYLKQNFRGLINYQRKYFSDAPTTLHEQRYDNRDAWTAYRIAESFNREGQPEKAEKYITLATSLAPHHPDFLQKAAIIAIKRENLIHADSLYQKLLSVKPYDPVNWNNLGYLYELRGKNEKAIETYHKAIACDPDYLPAYTKIAVIYARKKEFKKAVDIIQKAINIAPENLQLRQQMEWLKSQKTT
jgi:tetratricopeptide (TPR) repeat protein